MRQRRTKVARLMPKMRAMLEAGAKQIDVAKALGVSRETVCGVAAELGINTKQIRKKSKPVPPPAYTGPIRCGNTYLGVQGFVWGRTGDAVTMYLSARTANPKWDDPPILRTVSEAKLRAIGIAVPNFGGTVIFPRIEENRHGETF